MPTGGGCPTTCRDRWTRERDRVEAWIGEHCWSEARRRLSVLPRRGRTRREPCPGRPLRVRWRGSPMPYPGGDRSRTRARPIHYRYSGAEAEESCFLGLLVWMVEAWALLGERERAEVALDRLVAALGCGVGVWTEMADPATGAFLGNMPQGLTHLAHIMALDALAHSGEGEPRNC
ncbi:hypothetical protein AB5I41_10315 [Sphingomonas sp. MMS24-JH45]